MKRLCLLSTWPLQWHISKVTIYTDLFLNSLLVYLTVLPINVYLIQCYFIITLDIVGRKFSRCLSDSFMVCKHRNWLLLFWFNFSRDLVNWEVLEDKRWPLFPEQRETWFIISEGRDSIYLWNEKDFPGDASGKEFGWQCSRLRRYKFNPWVGKIPWGRKQQHTPVYLLGKSHGQKSLMGYSPWGCKRVGHDRVTEHVACKDIWKNKNAHCLL